MKEFPIEHFIDKINSPKRFRLSKVEKTFIENKYHTKEYTKIIYNIVHQISQEPVCKICGKPVSFKGIKLGYNKYCSHECQYKDKEYQEKINNTCIEKYGCKRYINQSHIVNSIDHHKGKEKEIDTRKKKYNGAYFSKEYYNNSKEAQEKRINNLLEKYGVTNVFQLDFVKERIRKTNLEKYGVEYPIQSDEIKKKYDWNKKLLKEIKTKKKNHSFNISIQETLIFEILMLKFPDVVHQYRSDKYPFNCDFYIPSIDTYIEYQGHWTHGGHPYNPIQDKEKLEIWESKNTKFYYNAIETWTIRDPKKRQTAKENNLNFIEFWNIDEVKEWIESYEKL